MKRCLIVMFGIVATIAMVFATTFGPMVRIADAEGRKEIPIVGEAAPDVNLQILESIARSLKVKVNDDPMYYLKIYGVQSIAYDETYLVVGKRPPFTAVPQRFWLLRADEGWEGVRILADIGPADTVNIGDTERSGFKDLIVFRGGTKRVMKYIGNAGRYRYAK